MWDQIPQKTEKKKKNYRISGFFAIFTLPYRSLRGVLKGGTPEQRDPTMKSTVVINPKKRVGIPQKGVL